MLYQVEDHSSKHSLGNLPKVGVFLVFTKNPSISELSSRWEFSSRSQV